MRVGDWKKGRPAGKTYAGGSRGLQMLASQHARQSETVHREGSKKVEAEEPREDSGQSSGKKRRVEKGEEGTLMETPTTPATAATNTKKEPASPYNASRLRLDGRLEEIFNETNPTPPRSDYSSGKDGDSGKSPTSVTSSKTIRPIIDHDENLVEGIDSDSGELLVEEETPAEAKARKQRQIENNLAAKSFIGNPTPKKVPLSVNITRTTTSPYHPDFDRNRRSAPPRHVPMFSNNLVSHGNRGNRYGQPNVSSFFGKSSAGTGLRNLGNTCYMNAVLQLLLGIPVFVDGVTDDERLATFRSLTEGESRFFSCFYDFVKKTQSQVGLVVAPSELKVVVGKIDARFRGYNQEDAHEFLSLVLNAIDEDLDILGVQHRVSFECFSLAMNQSFCCSLCQQVKSVTEDYLDLSVQIPEQPSPDGVSTSLQNAVEQFMSAEEVEWKCPGCQGKGMARLTHKFTRLPRVLMLHLKRFDADGKKLTSPVSLPVSLDLAPHTVESAQSNTLYTLKGLVVHMGSTIRSGHYICFSHGHDGRWRRYNDSRVDLVDAQSVFQETKSAYILCYVRNNHGGSTDDKKA